MIIRILLSILIATVLFGCGKERYFHVKALNPVTNTLTLIY